MTTVGDQFGAALAEAVTRTSDPRLLPMVLVEVCTDVLPVDGAGISLIENLRLPLAASSPAVVRAEKAQTTLGEGPCLTATELAEPLAAGPQEMTRQWPVFHSELLARTPFRSVLSVPLKAPTGTRFGAMDLYATDPDRASSDGLIRDAASLADLVSGALLGAPTPVPIHGASTYQWLANDSVRERMKVWVAVGTLIGFAELPHRDALDLLRGYAFAHQLSLDDVADQVAVGRLPPEDLVSPRRPHDEPAP